MFMVMETCVTKPDKDILGPLQVCSHPQTNICMCGTGSVSPGIKRLRSKLDCYVTSLLHKKPIPKPCTNFESSPISAYNKHQIGRNRRNVKRHWEFSLIRCPIVYTQYC